MTSDLKAMYEEFFTGKKPVNPIDKFIQDIEDAINEARPSLEMRTEKLENGNVLVAIQEWQSNGKLYRLNHIFSRNAIVDSQVDARIVARRLVREFELGLEQARKAVTS